ncbi:hypothetical protein SK128_004303 [Halocaridina rubra]|uniref:Uncharacterized protein n=1 Tax=Halocaridina rubra TaxID=373956 RepID=A0AAN9A5P8_HALRR
MTSTGTSTKTEGLPRGKMEKQDFKLSRAWKYGNNGKLRSNELFCFKAIMAISHTRTCFLMRCIHWS